MTNIGTTFEKEFSSELQSDRRKDSGNKWYRKLDVIGHRILWSLKATTKNSISIKKSDFDEVVEAVEGPGGYGAHVTPAMALRIGEHYDLVVLRKEDFIKMVQDKPVVMMTKAEEKRERGKVPELLKD